MPLTDAVRQTTEILNYRDARANVIPVSYGIESCRADPCALARELEKGGIDFTVHVVRFDVAAIEDQRQLSCLADDPGGQNLTASDRSSSIMRLKNMHSAVYDPHEGGFGGCFQTNERDDRS